MRTIALLSLIAITSTAAADPREDAFRAEAIRFGDIAIVNNVDASDTTPSVQTAAYRGDQRISLGQLFETVERPDLAKSLRRRRNFGLGATVVGGVAVLGATAMFAAKGVDDSSWRNVSIGVGAGGVALAIVGVYYLANANPVSDEEVHRLADAYNAKLRIKHGLAPATIVPYAGPDGGGLAMLGRF